MNYKQFSQNIKTKYPQYQDIDDLELANKMIAKYPQYQEQVEFDDVILDNNGGGDGTLDNTVTPSSTPVTGTYGATPTATASVSLPAQAASLTVAKLATELNGSPLADPDTANAQVGDIITYSYTITNTGNVTLTNVNLSDVFAGPPGGDGAVTAPVEDPSTLINNSGNSADAVVDGIWDTLGVNDVIVFTSTYTVTQSDVDNP